MKEITRYTVAADQARLARNAMNRSQNLGGNAASAPTRRWARAKKIAVALCLAAMATSACAEESKVGTAWQCGRDYIVVTYFGLGGAAQEASIWPNKKGPYGDAEELMLHQLGRPEATPNPYRWKNGKLYYRGKPCAKAKPPKDT